MSTPRFVPRKLLERPAEFGWASQPSWRSVGEGPEERDRLGAAKLQHQWVIAIRDGMRRRDLYDAEYAALAGMTPDRLRRMLAGRVLMRVEDVAAAQRIVGIELE